MTFTNDELILVLISLVRATRPSMLRMEGDGFTVDFEGLVGKQDLNFDERLLLKMRAAMETPPMEGIPLTLELDAAEGKRLAATLALLEKMQRWSPDVLEMSRALRARLDSAA